MHYADWPVKAAERGFERDVNSEVARRRVGQSRAIASLSLAQYKRTLTESNRFEASLQGSMYDRITQASNIV